MKYFEEKNKSHLLSQMIEIIAIIALKNDSNVNKMNNNFILFSVFKQYEIFGRKKELESHNYCHAWLIIAVVSECHYSTWSSKRLPADRDVLGQKPVVFEKIRKWPQKPRGQRCEMSDICSMTLILLSWNWPLLNYCQNRWRDEELIRHSLISVS